MKKSIVLLFFTFYLLSCSDNDKSIEITKSDLIEFINYGDSTFGLFIFHEDNISISFFSYLQIERIDNT